MLWRPIPAVMAAGALLAGALVANIEFPATATVHPLPAVAGNGGGGGLLLTPPPPPLMPEPAAMALLIAGVGLVGACRPKRKDK